MSSILSRALLIVCGVVFLILILGNYMHAFKERYPSWFGLSAASTVHDFRKSSEVFQKYWLENMCNDGACLHPVDWACGFTINRDDDAEYYAQKQKIESCFLSLVASAPLSDQLGKLRLLCGRRNMIFAGEWRGKPSHCNAVGGEWGKKARLFADENTYFRDE